MDAQKKEMVERKSKAGCSVPDLLSSHLFSGFDVDGKAEKKKELDRENTAAEVALGVVGFFFSGIFPPTTLKKKKKKPKVRFPSFIFSRTIALFSSFLSSLSQNKNQKKMWGFYSRMLARRPLLTKCLTASTLLAVGDVVAQKIEKKEVWEKTLCPGIRFFFFFCIVCVVDFLLLTLHAFFVFRFFLQEIEWKRTCRMAAIGFVFSGPMMASWYTVLEKVLPGTNLSRTLVKLALDQTIFAPAIISGKKKNKQLIFFAWSFCVFLFFFLTKVHFSNAREK
jgi:hypothetical protein